MAQREAKALDGVFSKLEGRLKVRYLGIGFLWAWIYGSYETFAVYPERAGVGINADPSWVVSAAARPSHWQSSSLGRRGSGRGHGPWDGSLGPRPCLSPARHIPYMGQRHLHRNRQRHVVRAVGPGSRPARHGEH